MNKLKVFVASPGDVEKERDIISEVIHGLRSTLGNALGVELETIRWETHAWPDIGVDAQDVINKEINEFDIFIGIMWKRFGTPTERAASGTEEEFQRAYEYHKQYNRPKVMFYFRQTPFFTNSLDDWSQYKKVIQFSKKLSALGLLFWT